MLIVDGPLPPWAAEMLKLMTEIVIMEPLKPMTAAIAVDYYTTPPTAEDDQFHQTPIGDRNLGDSSAHSVGVAGCHPRLSTASGA